MKGWGVHGSQCTDPAGLLRPSWRDSGCQEGPGCGASHGAGQQIHSERAGPGQGEGKAVPPQNPPDPVLVLCIAECTSTSVLGLLCPAFCGVHSHRSSVSHNVLAWRDTSNSPAASSSRSVGALAVWAAIRQMPNTIRQPLTAMLCKKRQPRWNKSSFCSAGGHQAAVQALQARPGPL